MRMLKAKGVDFVRVNLSHSGIEDLKYFIALAKKVEIPFILDTQGSQIRTGNLKESSVMFQEQDDVKIFQNPIDGDMHAISLTLGNIVSQLKPGDLIYIDFDSLVLRVSDTSSCASKGYIHAKVMTGGTLGRNKGVVIAPGFECIYPLPTLSEKDYEAIAIGLQEGVEYIAASFMRSGSAVDAVREATKGTMSIISKIECMDGLEHLDEIIEKSDYILIDRGDMSKEIPIEKIPLTQKVILHRAKQKGVGVFVATNLLETMIENNKPTRAEVHDVIATINDGAAGLTLAAETAIGRHPMECVNMIQKLVQHTTGVVPRSLTERTNDAISEQLEESNYLLDVASSSSLIPPHGGILVNRMASQTPDAAYLDSLPRIVLDQNKLMDLEQIAIGTYSPLEGFMGQKDFESVINTMRLPNGLVWTLPIVLDVSRNVADTLVIGSDVVLAGKDGEVYGLLHLEEKYTFDRETTAKTLFGTDSMEHPGVRQMVQNMGEMLLGGKISLFKRRLSPMKEFEFTPAQIRRLFEDRGWSRVVAFHTRNVIHRGHEFIQLEALKRANCDGLFVHPVVGKKKPGDFEAAYIVKAYEMMAKRFYPRQKVVFGTFTTYSRYAGPKEALFTAICRKNFGCSHIVIGRDHTGVKDFYHPKASHEIFDQFPDVGIEPVKFDKVFYSQSLGQHVHEADRPGHPEDDQLHISGTQARAMLERGELPPDWFMREEIATIIIEAIKQGEDVFVQES